MRFLDFFSMKKKPAETKPKFVGMSQKTILPTALAGKPAPDKQPAKEKKVAERRGITAPMQPYVAIVAEDIKRLWERVKRLSGVYKARQRKKEEYRDFMEEHFGREK